MEEELFVFDAHLKPRLHLRKNSSSLTGKRLMCKKMGTPVILPVCLIRLDWEEGRGFGKGEGDILNEHI